MSTLTAIELGTGRLTAVTVSAGAEIVSGGTAPLGAMDAAGVLAALKGCGLSEADLRQKVVLVVPRGQALFRDLEVPQGAPDEIVAMVRFQVEREMPLPLDQIRFSYIETGRAGGKVRVQVVAVPREILDPALAALEGAGIRVGSVTVSSYGLLALAPATERAVLVEVSGGEAEILVADGGRMEFSRTASFSAEVTPATVADEIQRTILAFSAKAPGQEVGRVVLAGRGDEAEKLAGGLTARLAKRVEGAGVGTLETAVAAGVCAALFRGLPMPDLLKPPVAVKKFRVTQTHRVGALAAVILIVLVVGSQVALSSKETRLRALEKERDALKPKAEQVARLSQQSSVAQEWYRDRHSWLSTFEGLHKPVDTGRLYLVSWTFDETGTVRIVGKAKEGKHIDDLVAAFLGTGQFKDLRAERRQQTEKGDYRTEFTLTGHLKGFDARNGKGK